MSPMPRMRLAMRSGWNSSSESGFSPALMNLMGLPVTSRMRKRAAATGVAVHLRHDDAVEIDPLGEGRSHVHHVLAGHGVDDHEDLVGLHRAT